MRIPENIIEEIKNRADIVEIIGEDLQLKVSGSNFKALSPFTSEKTPSFVVSRQKQIFKCFSSGKGGNVYSYLMEMHGMSFIEAVKHLADRYGVNLPNYASEDPAGTDDIHARALQALEILAQFYQEKLHSEDSEIAKLYLRKRKLTRKAILDFRLGFAPNSWSETYEYMLAQGFRNEELIATGGFSESKRGGLFDRFKGRIIFPIHNYLGKTIGFGGRDIGKGENTAKYINSPQTSIYNKSRVLYGIDLARDSMRSNGEAILTEGYMDVIAMHEAGFDNTVSTSGTALTIDMVKLLKRYCNKLYLVFDSDKAGINAAMRALPIAIAENIDIRVVMLDEGEDPDSIIKKKGAQSFRIYLREALSPIKFMYRTHKNRGLLQTPSSKANAIRETKSLLNGINDSITVDVYIQEIASLYGVSASTIYSSQNNQSNQITSVSDELSDQQDQKSKTNVLEHLSNSDKFLITIALESYDNLETLRSELNIHSDIFSSEEAAIFFDNILELEGSETPLDALMLSDDCSQEIKEAAAELILSAPTLSTRWNKFAKIDMEDDRLGSANTALKKILLKTLDIEKAALLEEIKSSSANAVFADAEAYLNRIKEIDNLKFIYNQQIESENS